MVQRLLTSSAVGRCEKQGGGGVVLVRQKNGGYLNRANSSCLMLKRGKFEGMIFANDCFFCRILKHWLQGLSLSPAEIGHLP